MKTFMTTTALATILATATALSVAAQTAELPAGEDPAAGQQDPAMSQMGAPDGFAEMPGEDQTAESLIGADVYGAEGDSIATVDDLVMEADGNVTHLVMDVGGFLGLGTHTVALDVENVTILWSDMEEEARVQVAMTQEELESLPEFEG